ncbi:MAG: S-adenosyl-l-methionine hydroxide adenosyltransferase family protein [Cyanophyceae cyanobacterium]
MSNLQGNTGDIIPSQLSRKLVAMVSDFGLIDNYVGVMKGVMLGIAPDVAIADITHQIPPQNLAAARYVLDTAVDYFPDNTVFLGVVDPGVGTERRGIAFKIKKQAENQLKNQYFVGPDNGIFSAILDSNMPIDAVSLTNANYWRSLSPSNTFHGRDIFAPVAAHLANGVPLKDLGEAIASNTLTRLNPPSLKKIDGGWEGVVQYIDHFGNVVTTIPGDVVGDQQWSLPLSQQSSPHAAQHPHIGQQSNPHKIPGCRAYGETKPGDLLALVGSHGWIEVAQNQGNGAIATGLTYGDSVQVLLES